MSRAEQIVSQALFGVDDIAGEPQNYYLHRDTFLAAVRLAIDECAAIAETIETEGRREFAGDADCPTPISAAIKALW